AGAGQVERPVAGRAAERPSRAVRAAVAAVAASGSADAAAARPRGLSGDDPALAIAALDRQPAVQRAGAEAEDHQRMAADALHHRALRQREATEHEHAADDGD